MRLLASGLILILFSSGAGASQGFPLAGDDPVIRNAVIYLLSCQNDDGGFANLPDAATSSLLPTANAAMALALTGDLDHAKAAGKTPLDYLVTNPPGEDASGGSLGRYVMGVVAARGDPRNVNGVDYAERLKKFAKPPYGKENLFSEAYILLALAAAGESESPEAQAFVSHIKAKQHSSGGWGWGGGAPDLDTTGIVASALLAAGEDPKDQTIHDAIEYIRSQQNDDGGFPSSGMSSDSNAISDYWAMMALNGAGVDPTQWRKGRETLVSHLLSCQQESGVFWWKPKTQGGAGFLVEATSYSIIALMGKSLPVPAADPVEVVEEVSVTVYVLGDGNPLFSRDLAVGAEGFTRDGFEVSNPTVLGALAGTGLFFTLADPDGTGRPTVSNLEGYGSAIYFVDGARQTDPIGEYDLIGDECIVISAPATVLPLRLKAPAEVVEGETFTLEVGSEELDDRGQMVSAPVEGATVTVFSGSIYTDYTTGKDGRTPEMTLRVPGEYRIEAKKEGYIATYYLNCGYQIISCRRSEPVDVTIHVLGNGAPLFSGEVEVKPLGFEKDGYDIDNPTALGALEVTGVSYTLGDPWGMGSPAVTDLAGFGMPVYFVNGASPNVGLDQYFLSDGDWITVTAPYTVYPLKMTAPTEVIAGERFKIKVETEEYDASWNLVTVAQQGATVTVGSQTYTTGADGYTPEITLTRAGEYKVRADKAGYISTYYLTPGGYQFINCLEAEGETVTIHVLGNGNPLFSREVFVSSVGFEKDGYKIDNPTALGALEVTGVSYTLGDPWGMGSPAVTDLAGFGMPVYYVNGASPNVGLDQYFLSNDDWITVSAPYSVYLLKMTVPTEVSIGDPMQNPFKIKVESEEYDASWNLVTVPQQGATVTVGSQTYTTGADGNTSDITLTWAGEYKVKASKAGYIGTYYLTPGGYHIITATGEIESDLLVKKEADSSSAEVGDILNYTITICNNYPYAVTDVIVTDGLPEESSFEYADPWPDTRDGNYLEWNLSEEIPPGGCEVINLRVKVDDTPTSGHFINCVEVVARDENDGLIGARACSTVSMAAIDPLMVIKTADKKSVERGKKIKYTIKVCNNYKTSMLDVTVTDAFNKDVEFVSADPAPIQEYGEGDRFREIAWSHDSIEPGCKDITLEVIVPKMQDFEFGMEQRVRGVGFVNVANDYTTAPPQYALTNTVKVTAKNSTNSLIAASASATVGVSDSGTELSTREHGSGSYESEDLVAVKTAEKSIEMAKEVSASYATTAIGLYNNRSVAYSSRWTQTASGKNRITGTSMSEAYRYATSIDRDSHFKIDEMGTSMAFEAEFEGMGSFRVFKKPTSGATPDFESEETYLGSFKVRQVAEDPSIKYEKAASGTGFVVADKRIGGRQRSYEAGTGRYESDEIIEAATNYIAKDISLESRPTSFNLPGGRSIDASGMWREGIWSKNASKNSTTFIGEEFSSLHRLHKETVVRGLGDVATVAEFSGTGRFRIISVDTNVNKSENGSLGGSMKRLQKADIEIDEQYSGDYSMARRVIFAGVFEYDEPHLSADKSGEIFYTEDAILARYNITIRNDGNRALGPLLIRDLLPPGAEFINSSERTSSLSDEGAEWTFLNLGLGGTLTFTLWLDVTECRGDEIVNVVEARGGYNNEVTTAVAFSALETDWLGWTREPSVTATKAGVADGFDPRVVTYTLTVQNLDSSAKVAEVTDKLPEGMRFLNSSVEPSYIDDQTVVWTLLDIGPYEEETIVYAVEALGSGKFLNRAIVEARSVDGRSSPLVYASSVVDIGEFEGEIELTPPIWRPPAWGLEYMDGGSDLGWAGLCDLRLDAVAVES
ncbi:prenyltransferase/squalene oxidase repeat-containing protein [Candidatus Methanocrinis natronophilus]|uniref:Prenyltransferase/squalene oxidase repeat-containing protein n=1 Tax=Candidatus Methanocrinis natronophilus TaxID=3033396 RepID=A0ABT5X5A1_9EURY|nr:prenyltransferase/squalene oxidase repeat-containing protein [Candidatus Methanocrinis natronophilus]MDF0589879.1 prenyltransferase/squalene oxidase repeat-containing protein [Candidatus Methanocrinis natronophilus]